MPARLLPALALFACLAAATGARSANSQADFAAALAAAQTAEAEAGVLKNQWTTTEDTLTAAKTAAAASNFDTAVSEAKNAEALAKASIAQAKEQQSAWKAAVIR
jgi:hypothetical protein